MKKAKIIVTSSYKGGTGKSTINILLAETLASKNKKVLLIDLDSNCTLSQCYNQLFKDITSRHFLSEQSPNFKGIYSAKENIDIIPSDIENNLLSNIMDTQLKINLKRTGLIEKYDYIILDPPGHWGAHTRNAVFAADILIITGTCSSLDFHASETYFQILQNCFIEADTFICINASNAKTNEPGIIEKYQASFGEYLVPEPVPYIKSLKRLTQDVNYSLHPSVKKRLDPQINYILGGE